MEKRIDRANPPSQHDVALEVALPILDWAAPFLSRRHDVRRKGKPVATRAPGPASAAKLETVFDPAETLQLNEFSQSRAKRVLLRIDIIPSRAKCRPNQIRPVPYGVATRCNIVLR
jgi:hypothetical protein